MAKSYYGSKLSRNKIQTDEGYLICKNVPIGRTGWMDYLGQELPSAFAIPYGHKVKVFRSPEELFSERTISSFEGKPVTNMHPVSNLTLDTAPMIARGHVQNVRPDGEFLIADLFIMDAGLISEIQNKLKREVSSGYDCAWFDLGDGKYEQREIVGNHVAVVQNGRAGARVAIQDQKPEGGTRLMSDKITHRLLTAIGFKQFVKDAEPEEVAKVMDELKAPPVEAPATGEEPADKLVMDEGEASEMGQLISMMNRVLDRIERLEAREEEQSKKAAESIMDEAEEEYSEEGEMPEKQFGEEEKEAPAEEAPPAEEEAPPVEEEEKEKMPAQDAASIRKFIQDMKPIIMAIPDENLRLEGAKRLTSFVKDSRPRGNNGYATIANTVTNNKKHQAMDSQSKQNMTNSAELAVKKWAERGAEMKGGK